MSKKKHKIGTTILLALAPACALGVTIGIVATSKKVGPKEEKMDPAEWFKEYTEIWQLHQKARTSFTVDEVSLIVNGKTETPKYISDEIPYNLGRSSSIFYKDTSVAISPVYEPDDLEDYYEDFKSDDWIFSKSDKELSIYIPYCDEETGWEKFSINEHGYVTKYASYYPEQTNGNYSYEVTYNAEPHLVTKYKTFWQPNYNPASYISGSFRPDTTQKYSIELAVDNTNKVDQFCINGATYPDDEHVKLTNIDIEGLTTDQWSYNSSTNFIEFKNSLLNKTITISFYLNPTKDWKGFRAVANSKQ